VPPRVQTGSPVPSVLPLPGSIGALAPIVEPLPPPGSAPPSEPAGRSTGDPGPSGSSPAGSDWSAAVGQYSASLKRLEVAVGSVQVALAKMPDNSAAISSVIASQKRLDEQIRKSIESQTGIQAGLTTVAGRVADSVAVTSDTKSATTSLAEIVTRTIAKSESITTAAIKDLAAGIPAVAPWWLLPAQALGLTGPLGAAAVAITWLVSRRVGRSGKTSGAVGSGATEVAPRPFLP